MFLKHEGDCTAESWIGKLVQGDDPGGTRDRRFFFTHAFDDRSDAVPDAGDFANANDQSGSEACYKHRCSNAEVVSHSFNGFDRALITLFT